MKWAETKLEKYACPGKGAVVSGPFGSNIGSRFFVDEGVPVIRGNNLTMGESRFVDEGFVFLTEEKATEFRNCQAIYGDLVFTAAGSIGQVGVIPPNSRYDHYIISNKQLRIRCDPDKANPLFLYYWFALPQMRQYIIGQNKGCSIPLINLSVLRNLPVPEVPCAEQDEIVEVLSAYDDLIENNRRRIALLEQAARLLYEEWFVRLKFPGHERTRINNGFPEGWEKGTIADFYDTTSGGTPSRSNPDFYNGEINWVKTQELNDGFIFETEERITEMAIEKSSAKVFPENTVLVSIYGGTNIGRTAILAQPAATNQACCALFPRDPRAHFIYTALYFRENREKLISLAQGAAQTNISQQVVRSLQILFPKMSIASMFVESLTPVFEQLKNVQRQNAKLRAARDLLLPRLMSGEIEV